MKIKEILKAWTLKACQSRRNNKDLKQKYERRRHQGPTHRA